MLESVPARVWGSQRRFCVHLGLCLVKTFCTQPISVVGAGSSPEVPPCGLSAVNQQWHKQGGVGPWKVPTASWMLPSLFPNTPIPASWNTICM